MRLCTERSLPGPHASGGNFTHRGFGPQPDHLHGLHGGCHRCSTSAAVWVNLCFHAIALRLTGRSSAAGQWMLWQTCWIIRRRHTPGHGPATLHSFCPCRQGLSVSPCMHVQTYPPYHKADAYAEQRRTLHSARSLQRQLPHALPLVASTQAGCAFVAHRRRGPSTVPSIRSRVCRACVASGCAAPACAA